MTKSVASEPTTDVPFFELTRQFAAISQEIDGAIGEVLHSQRFVLGPVVADFEKRIAEYVGVPHAIGCASGTDALLLCLKALQRPHGSEVVVPAFTFFATAGAVWNAGYRPVFADIDPATYNITPETVEPLLSERTVAVIPVHLFGQMAEMGPLTSLADERGITVIEDGAQSIGAEQDIDGWKRAGSVGRAGCFSFFPTKNLGGFGDGGMITTTDEEFAAHLRKLRVHGGEKMYHHEVVGFNSRLDALQAAVLREKLPFLDQWIAARRAHARHYDNAFVDLEPQVVRPTVTAENRSVWNQYTIRAARRDELAEHLAARGIGCNVYYPVPLHLQPCFAELGYGNGDLPESERAAREVLSLPIFPELYPHERDRVIEAVHDFAGGD